jgi:hypothetical protein
VSFLQLLILGYAYGYGEFAFLIEIHLTLRLISLSILAGSIGLSLVWQRGFFKGFLDTQSMLPSLGRSIEYRSYAPYRHVYYIWHKHLIVLQVS